MSLESELKRTNELLEQLLAKVSPIGISTSVEPVTPAPVPQTDKTVAAPPLPAQAPAVPTPPPAELDYERDVLPEAKKFLAKKGREGLAALLQEFGVPNARDLKGQRLELFLKRIKEGAAA